MNIIISIDEIKKQLLGYKPEHSEKVHREAAMKADKNFGVALKASKLKQVILMCGGSASGKTEFLSEYLKDTDAIIFDGTLSTSQGAKIKLSKIIKAKKKPVIYFVYPENFKIAFEAFLNRERKFSDEHFYRTHSGSRKTILWIAQNYPEAKIKIYENQYKKYISFREIIFIEKNKKIDFLERMQYSEKEIIKIITEYDQKKS